MKERPVLFNQEMVQAILDGRKTQTRRALKVQYDTVSETCNELGNFFGINKGLTPTASFKCPFGQVGDRLWVRETWCTHVMYDHKKPSELREEKEFVHYIGDNVCGLAVGKTRPSIFMPRWASRITLEITDVRVERLQDISDIDALSEGIEYEEHVGEFGEIPTYLCKNYLAKGEVISKAEDNEACEDMLDTDIALTPQDSFKSLWDSIYKNASENPWVWVVEFKVMEGV